MDKKYCYFSLINLTNDKPIGMFPCVTLDIIEEATKLHEISIHDIGIYVEQAEPLEKSEINIA